MQDWINFITSIKNKFKKKNASLTYGESISDAFTNFLETQPLDIQRNYIKCAGGRINSFTNKSDVEPIIYFARKSTEASNPDIGRGDLAGLAEEEFDKIPYIQNPIFDVTPKKRDLKLFQKQQQALQPQLRDGYKPMLIAKMLKVSVKFVYNCREKAKKLVEKWISSRVQNEINRSGEHQLIDDEPKADMYRDL